MDKAAWNLNLGIFILCLSLIVRRATGIFVGWLALYLPGSVYVFRGLIETFAA